MARLFFSLAAALCLASCQSVTSPSLVGTWESQPSHTAQKDSATTTGDTPAARLIVFPDNTFHVDVPAKEGIEVEGHLRLERNQVTFINDRGTDAVASDPTPGTYAYAVSGGELVFERISDPLNRRARFLSQPWTRID